MDSVEFFWGRKVFNSDKFSIVSEARNSLVAFAEKQQIKINSYQKLKHGYLIHSLSDTVLRLPLLIEHTILAMEDHFKLCLQSRLCTK